VQNLKLLKYLSVLLLLSVSHSANANVMFDVTSATGTSSSCPHGLWTNQDHNSGACGNHYDINAWLTIYDEDPDNLYAKLWGSASNGDYVAEIDLTFKDFAETHKYKQEGGAVYDPDYVDFFTTVMGTIEIDSHIYDIDFYAGDYAFQFGHGSSAKDPYVYGASAWIQSCKVDNAAVRTADTYECMDSHHWDLNLDITKKVPEPSVIALFAAGLFGLGFARRRIRS